MFLFHCETKTKEFGRMGGGMELDDLLVLVIVLLANKTQKPFVSRLSANLATLKPFKQLPPLPCSWPRNSN